MLNELLVPRKAIKFTSLQEGRFIPIASDVPEQLKTPMVRSKAGDVEGYESGYRSGLLKLDQQLYKFKGCRPEGGAHGGQPMGSSLLSTAQREADRVLVRREVFLSEGFDYPIEPIGFWVYDHFMFSGEPNAATIYRAKGDTRVDEFLWWIEKMPVEFLPKELTDQLLKISAGFGYGIGNALRSFHRTGFSWDNDIIADGSNSHTGNVLIFPDAEANARLGMVDFDISSSYTETSSNERRQMIEEIQIRDLAILTSSAQNGVAVSTAKRQTSMLYESGYLVQKIVDKIAPGLNEEIRGEAGGYLLTELNPGIVYPDLLREDLVTGIRKGYARSEIRSTEIADEKISWNELVQTCTLVPKMRKEFLLRAKALIGEDLSPARIRELANMLYSRD